MKIIDKLIVFGVRFSTTISVLKVSEEERKNIVTLLSLGSQNYHLKLKANSNNKIRKL